MDGARGKYGTLGISMLLCSSYLQLDGTGDGTDRRIVVLIYA
jgi:hypothetical protein